MTRRRKILIALLIPSIAWAVWQWVRPYEWNADAAANATIQFAQIRRDRDYHWLDLKVQIKDSEKHDLSKGLALILADGREQKPDGLTLEGSGAADVGVDGPSLPTITGMALRFWMNPGDLTGPLKLRINDGTLQVRRKSAPPSLEDGETKTYHDSHW